MGESKAKTGRIVVFGASTDLGQRVARILEAAGRQTVLVSRTLAGAIPADLRDPASVRAVIAGAGTIVCCAKADFAPALIAASATEGTPLVLVGSAWRWSSVDPERAGIVRAAEEAFLASGRPGAILHPTMIYGGTQEVNLSQLLRLLVRWPVLPLPGGGRHMVQPVHVDDVAEAVARAALRDWSGPNVIAVPGAWPITWREMARFAADALGRRPFFLTIPLGLVVAALRLAAILRLPLPVSVDVVRRFRENVVISTDPLVRELGVHPRSFEDGVGAAVREWRERGDGPQAVWT